MEDIIAVTLIFGGGTLFALSISPIGRAIAERISRKASEPSEVVEQLRETQLAMLDDLESVRRELSEVQERVDFAERLLTQRKNAPGLPESSRHDGATE